jgi:hypothetical protein
MAGKRFQGDHGCCSYRADGSCALATVGRLSEERILELATKCAPAEGFQVAAETGAFLAAQGVDLSGEQQTKTKTALQYFSQNLTAAATS